MVVRNDLSFFVGIRYENLPLYCTQCGITGHNLASCRFRGGMDKGPDKMKKPKSPKVSQPMKDNPKSTDKATPANC